MLRSALKAVAWDGPNLAVTGTVVIRDVDEGSPVVHLIADNDGVRHRIPCATGPGDLTHDGRATAFTAAGRRRLVRPPGFTSLSPP
ncbi:hypothetical protein [Actinomadura chokoriensis]|uniref:Uncharacterized protein n=1 Tax=Actinomadura chokoriensis TaxID=454156 RepID=A0ABV4QUF4_9ACTN